MIPLKPKQQYFFFKYMRDILDGWCGNTYQTVLDVAREATERGNPIWEPVQIAYLVKKQVKREA